MEKKGAKKRDDKRIYNSRSGMEEKKKARMSGTILLVDFRSFVLRYLSILMK